MNVKRILLFLILHHQICFSFAGKGITGITNGGARQLGDCAASYAMAKLLSHRYNLKFYRTDIGHFDLLKLSQCDDQCPPQTAFKHLIHVTTENDIINNLDKEDVYFWADIASPCAYIDPAWVDELKSLFQPLEHVELHPIPKDKISIAVHIRKGNGGGQYYDGKQSSLQLYNFNRSIVRYITNYQNYCFEWDEYIRGNIPLGNLYTNIRRGPDKESAVDKVSGWETRFPPDQFYIDHIRFISEQLHDAPLYVQFFTDDKDRQGLVARIINAVNKPNITFYIHHDHPFGELPEQEYQKMMLEDLYNMSRFDVLIRGQSYFSRVAELMGNHKVVIFPIGFTWIGNALIMKDVVIRGSIQSLTTRN